MAAPVKRAPDGPLLEGEPGPAKKEPLGVGAPEDGPLALMAIEETKDTMTESEKALLMAAASSSHAKRLQNKKDK